MNEGDRRRRESRPTATLARSFGADRRLALRWDWATAMTSLMGPAPLPLTVRRATQNLNHFSRQSLSLKAPSLPSLERETVSCQMPLSSVEFSTSLMAAPPGPPERNGSRRRLQTSGLHTGLSLFPQCSVPFTSSLAHSSLMIEKVSMRDGEVIKDGDSVCLHIAARREPPNIRRLWYISIDHCIL